MNYKQAKIADSAKVAKETVLVGDITIGEKSLQYCSLQQCAVKEKSPL